MSIFKTADLSNALQAVAPFAADATAADNLDVVCIEVAGGALRLSATDRYVIGAVKVHPAAGHPKLEGEGKVLVQVTDIKTAVKWLAAARRDRLHAVTVTVRDDGLTLRVSDQGDPRDVCEVPGVDGSHMPDIWRLFPAHLGEPTPVPGLGMGRLRTIASVRDRRRRASGEDGSNVVFGSPTRPGGPVPFVIDDWFVGLIMPTRTTSTGDDRRAATYAAIL